MGTPAPVRGNPTRQGDPTRSLEVRHPAAAPARRPARARPEQGDNDRARSPPQARPEAPRECPRPTRTRMPHARPRRGCAAPAWPSPTDADRRHWPRRRRPVPPPQRRQDQRPGRPAARPTRSPGSPSSAAHPTRTPTRHRQPNEAGHPRVALARRDPARAWHRPRHTRRPPAVHPSTAPCASTVTLNHRVETLSQFSGKLTRGPWTSHRNRHVLVAGRRVHLMA